MVNSVKIVAEIGINHNGSMDIAKDLIKLAAVAGCDYVKIQKRNPDICVPEHQKDIMKDTPWGRIKYIDYKKKIEFNEDQIVELVAFSKQMDISFFASVWDKDSVDIMARYTDIGKIPSALITDFKLCSYARQKFKTLIVSTGMSTEREIEDCILLCNPDIIMHTNSTYPCPISDLNLNYIKHLKKLYPDKQVGYSGHEEGLVASYAAVAMGSTWLERHVTLDKGMWGSDQKSSIEPTELITLVQGVRDIEMATRFEPGPRVQFEAENVKKKSLRK